MSCIQMFTESLMTVLTGASVRSWQVRIIMHGEIYFQLFFILIPCILEYVEIASLFFIYYDSSHRYCTPVRGLRHTSYDLFPAILTLKWLRKEHSCSLTMASFC
jgi:hypothetical protein